MIGGAALLTPALMFGGLRLLDLLIARWPLIARWVGSHGRMAVRNVGAGLSRTAVATAALMVAIATTIGVGILIESFRNAVGDWLYGVLRADLYITTPGPDATAPAFELDRAFRDRIVALPEVEAVSTVRRFRVEVAGHPRTSPSMRWPRDRTGVFASRKARPETYGGPLRNKGRCWSPSPWPIIAICTGGTVSRCAPIAGRRPCASPGSITITAPTAAGWR